MTSDGLAHQNAVFILLYLDHLLRIGCLMVELLRLSLTTPLHHSADPATDLPIAIEMAAAEL